MCKCTPEIRTPFCGRGDCLPPGYANLGEWLGIFSDAEAAEAAAQASLDRVWEQAVRQSKEGDTMGKPLNYYPGEGNAEVLSFQQVGLYSVEVGRLWACVNCGTAVLARREDLRNCRVCALMAQMQMAIPNG